MKTNMSFSELDALCNRVGDNSYKCGDWWPTIEEIKTYIEPNLSKHVEFLCWILETADAPVTKEQIESKKYINALLIRSIHVTGD